MKINRKEESLGKKGEDKREMRRIGEGRTEKEPGEERQRV